MILIDFDLIDFGLLPSFSGSFRCTKTSSTFQPTCCSDMKSRLVGGGLRLARCGNKAM